MKVTMDQFTTFTSEDWLNYLSISNLFSVEFSADEIDQMFTTQLAKHFDYKIKSSHHDTEAADVKLSVTSLDLESIMLSCRDELLAYASSTESIRASDDEFSEKLSEILLEALKNNTSTVTTDITIHLIPSDRSWEPILDDTFTNALFDHLDESFELLNP